LIRQRVTVRVDRIGRQSTTAADANDWRICRKTSDDRVLVTRGDRIGRLRLNTTSPDEKEKKENEEDDPHFHLPSSERYHCLLDHTIHIPETASSFRILHIA